MHHPKPPMSRIALSRVGSETRCWLPGSLPVAESYESVRNVALVVWNRNWHPWAGHVSFDIGGIVTNGDAAPPGFEADIKPMFRDSDREAMQRHFDLRSHDDVSKHAEAILARLRDGSMPCDGAWPAAQVDLFQDWVEGGRPQ